ncbi:MAG: GNAT family N-acetyltransferase [bacterium]|nr:GNAT family N-acetyltransferase [bacterium]
MEKTVTLKDRTTVLIRHMERDDVQASFDFFQKLPPEDRKYLRVDVANWEFVDRRVRLSDDPGVERLVVLDDDEIVGDGALELAGHGWGEGAAEIRLIIARHFQRTGLGTTLARELHFLAAQHKVDRLIARLLRPQAGAHQILHNLGFHEEFLVPRMSRDRSGELQDMIIMRCNLIDYWREMETVAELSDWRRAR